MRIALVSDTYTPQVNGVSTVLRRMVESLAAAGHETAVVAPEYPGTAAADLPGELRIASAAFPPYPAIRLSLPAWGRVSRWLDERGPELVHVVTEGPLGLIGRRYALARGLPLVTSYHTHFPRYCQDYGVPMLEPAAWAYMRWFHGPARVVQTPGQEARDALVAHGITQAVVWGNGVDTRRFHHARRNDALRRRLGIADHQVAVLHVGRLAPEKNLDVLIHAFTAARDALGDRARFLVAGDGPLSERISARLPWALRFGFMAVERLADLYALSDLCVLTSETETCGLVALEAMASGVPVVAADAGGFRDTVLTGVNGLRVPSRDPSAFAAAIVRLAMEPARRRRLSTQARVTAVARDAALEDAELLDLYRSLLGREPERDAWRAAS
jgi:glycosyltransferase involved in cell wall biosynthesis